MTMANGTPTHDKSVDSPLCHRELKNHNLSEQRERMQEQQQQEFKIGTKYEHKEPHWELSQRFGCKAEDHYGMLTDGYPTEGAKPTPKDFSGNHDWTKDTGSSVQKVLKDKHDRPQQVDKSKCDAWANTSNAKVMPKAAADESPRRVPDAWGAKTVPNEKKESLKPSQRGDLVDSWNTQAMKVLPKEPKRVLDLCPKPAPAPAPKKIMRPEDWDSNLKTLPDAGTKGVAPRHAHVYNDIKDSVVPHTIRRSPHVKHF